MATIRARCVKQIRTKTARPAPTLEELESRFCPTSVCNANPSYEAECNYLNNLIPNSAITVTAVQSGNWSNPATWGGKLPGNGDNVWIPNGIKVTVDQQEPGHLRSILDNGILTFASNVNTGLNVNTLVVGTDNNATGLPQGELDIGTASNPIQANVTATITFADLGSQAQLFPNDPEQLSGGLISMGTLNIYGSQVTPYLNMNNANAGATTLTLLGQPIGWKVGDTLLLPGTTPNSIEDEQIQIAGLHNNSDGTATVTLASPLQYTHSAPTGQSVQVADENRSIVIQSQDINNQDGAKGHVMQMHNDAASVQYAALLDLGRTNKAIPLNSAQFDANGNVIPGTGLNQIGRYALHFHRDYYPGLTDSDPPIQVVGNFEMGSPGWGYDNHSSNVDFIDNVAYDNFGAAFVDQAGNELGSFQNNLAINTPGVPNGLMEGSRSFVQDFGWTGDGFWLTSPSTSVIGNHVWEAQLGYGIYTDGLVQNGLGLTNSWNNQTINDLPLATFSNDTAAVVDEGLSLEWREAPNTTPDTIDHFTAWDVTSEGIDVGYYTSNINLVDDTLLGVAGATTGIMPNTGGYTTFVNVIGADVEGFQTGIQLIPTTIETVHGGYWNDTTAMYIAPMQHNRQIIISGPITFGPNVAMKYYIQQTNAAAYISASNPWNVFDPNCVFEPDQILLPDGRQLYAPDQAADYVPFASGSYPNLPTPFIGLTNSQLWSQYGAAPEGFVASADATTDPSTNGLIGSAQVLRPNLVTPEEARVAVPYTVSYALQKPDGTVVLRQTQSNPVMLQAGWNVLTQASNGSTYSWLVYGVSYYPPALQSATLGTAYSETIDATPGDTISVSSVNLPTGLSLSLTDNVLTISGTPTVAGDFGFTFSATTPSGFVETRRYDVFVYANDITSKVSKQSSTIAYDAATQTYYTNVNLTYNGPTLTGTFAVSASNLPPGAALTGGKYYNGVYLVPITLPGSSLSIGQSTMVTLRFSNPYNAVLVGYTINIYQIDLNSNDA